MSTAHHRGTVSCDVRKANTGSIVSRRIPEGELLIVLLGSCAQTETNTIVLFEDMGFDGDKYEQEENPTLDNPPHNAS